MTFATLTTVARADPDTCPAVLAEVTPPDFVSCFITATTRFPQHPGERLVVAALAADLLDHPGALLTLSRVVRRDDVDRIGAAVNEVHPAFDVAHRFRRRYRPSFTHQISPRRIAGLYLEFLSQAAYRVTRIICSTRQADPHCKLRDRARWDELAGLRRLSDDPQGARAWRRALKGYLLSEDYVKDRVLYARLARSLREVLASPGILQSAKAHRLRLAGRTSVTTKLDQDFSQAWREHLAPHFADRSEYERNRLWVMFTY